VLLQDRAFNDRRYYIGSSKLEALGWRESTSWEEGLAKTRDWWVWSVVWGVETRGVCWGGSHM
jgi:dTDP-D-glucose 4,6-dehydratase